MEVDDDWDDGSGWLATLASLRADVLSGDLRLFYLLWLTAVQDERLADTDVEPLPGIGPLTGGLEAFAEFFGVDPDLMQAAAELGADGASMSNDDLRDRLAAIPEREKTEFLLRVVEGDAHVAAALRGRVRKISPALATLRTVGALRTRASEIAEARERADAGRREAERRHKAEEAERERRARLEALKRRGEGVWREIDEEIERRNPAGYEKAANLLFDLQELAAEQGSQSEFARRLASIRVRHERKARFIERLNRLGSQSDERAF